jgi:hypothetical protein
MSDVLHRLLKKNLQAVKIDRLSESEYIYIYIYIYTFLSFSMDLASLSFVFLDTLRNIHSFKV